MGPGNVGEKGKGREGTNEGIEQIICTWVKIQRKESNCYL